MDQPVSIEKQSFKVIGISVRTTNEDGQAGKDLGALWGRFMAENIAAQIPGKTDASMYCLYTDYEKDHTRPYTAVLGCAVKSLEEIPQGMSGYKVPGGNFAKFSSRGNLEEGMVFQAWTEIWNTNLSRAYTTDFEIYGEKAKDPKNAEVDIFVAVNKP